MMLNTTKKQKLTRDIMQLLLQGYRSVEALHYQLGCRGYQLGLAHWSFTDTLKALGFTVRNRQYHGIGQPCVSCNKKRLTNP